MEKKFSQGKWTNCGANSVSCDGKLIAHACSADVRYEQSEANAKLIAAAPELLYRLNSLVLSVKAHPDYIFGEEGDEWHDIVSLAEETIKKATE